MVRHYKAILVVAVCLFIPMGIAQANVSQYYDLTSSLPSELSSMKGTKELKDKFNMNTTHFILVNEDLSNREMQEITADIEGIDGIESVVSYEKYVGGLVPESFEPQAVKNLFANGGYKMIIANSDYHAASEEENHQIEEMYSILHAYDQDALITGEGALTKDLITTADKDFQVVNVLSIAAIFVIILLTFVSFSLPFVLVLAIELAITVNMAVPYFTNTTLPFIAGIVIGTIQLGACVDYAILMTTRTREELGRHRDIKTAVRIAVSKSAPSIITSGCSFFAACIGVALISRMDMISSLCELLARGALISVISIIFVLPSMLLAGNKLIAKTTRKWPHQERRNNK